jgi:DNA-binding NarL/FixJ family response regulator
MPRVLLVDDHPLYHEGLASVLARLAPDIAIVGAGSAQAGLMLLHSSSIDLALIDLVLPGGDGLSAMALYAAEFPHLPRVLISGKEQPGVLQAARDAGASGFIPKSLPIEQLILALRRILDGESYFELAPSVPAEAAPGAASGQQLTLRQLEVLKLLGEGRSNKEISSALAIADRTVRAHLTELFRMLGVSSRTQAILVGQRLGLLPAP